MRQQWLAASSVHQGDGALPSKAPCQSVATPHAKLSAVGRPLRLDGGGGAGSAAAVMSPPFPTPPVLARPPLAWPMAAEPLAWTAGLVLKMLRSSAEPWEGRGGPALLMDPISTLLPDEAALR
ncbi:UNVERIFIED_CONTAM: hypothetical protein K2H54_048313 [Gekko kuhli]